MIPWEELGRAQVPGEARALVLLRRGGEYVIRIGARTLMSSAAHASEDSLAGLACAAAPPRADARVLIGGLGMGFTLAAALRVLPPGARVVVAELLPAVVAWNRGPLAPLAGAPLDDSRVEVHVGDVADRIHAEGGSLDVLLLDVDNGPDALTHSGNARLYSPAGLAAAARALRRGGVLGVWSVQRDPAFTRRLHETGFVVQERTVRAREKRGGRHVLWFATRR